MKSNSFWMTDVDWLLVGCPHCSVVLTFTARAVGRIVACPECNAQYVVPSGSTETAAVETSPSIPMPPPTRERLVPPPASATSHAAEAKPIEPKRSAPASRTSSHPASPVAASPHDLPAGVASEKDDESRRRMQRAELRARVNLAIFAIGIVVMLAFAYIVIRLSRMR